MKWLHLAGTKDAKYFRINDFDDPRVGVQATCGRWFKTPAALVLDWRDATCPRCRSELRDVFEVQHSHRLAGDVPEFEAWADERWNGQKRQEAR